MFLLKILLHLLSLGKCLSVNVRKVFATFVATLMLEKGVCVCVCGGGGVELGYFPLSRFLLFIGCFLEHVISNCRFLLYPFFFRPSVYGGHASLNI